MLVNRKKLLRSIPAVAALSLVLISASSAVGATITITFDENGKGSIVNSAVANAFNMPGSTMADPGPGGLASVLAYNLLNPPALVTGDVIIVEPGGGQTTTDLLRFNFAVGGGTVFVYSDIGDGADSLADVGFPSAFFTNTVTVTEVGAEGANGITYTPSPGQPGYVTGANGPVTYVFASDSAVPEPSSILLILSGAGALCFRRFRRSKVAGTN